MSENTFFYQILQKTKFSNTDFFSKCHQVRSFLRIWSHLLKKSLMENFKFCAVRTVPSDFFWLWFTKFNHCVKNVRIRSYSGAYFLTFRLNTDQNNSSYGHLSRSECYCLFKIKLREILRIAQIFGI